MWDEFATPGAPPMDFIITVCDQATGESLGHSSIQVTVDIYGHLIPGANRQAVDRLDHATERNPGATRSQAAIEL